MSNKYTSVIKQINKGYKLPHDIEVVAHKIYALSLSEENFANNDIISKFIDSVLTSEYKNIIEITYNYMNKLIYFDGNLLYEEYLKILHLFDSLNIFYYFGLNESSKYKEMSDYDIRLLIKKHPKWSKGIPSEVLNFKNKKWWQRVINK